MVQLVGTGMVQILTLGIQLHSAAQSITEPLQMGDGRGPALEFLADTPQLRKELSGLRNGKIGFRDISHGGTQFIGNIAAAVPAKITLFIGVVVKISLEIYAIEFHTCFLLKI